MKAAQTIVMLVLTLGSAACGDESEPGAGLVLASQDVTQSRDAVMPRDSAVERDAGAPRDASPRDAREVDMPPASPCEVACERLGYCAAQTEDGKPYCPGIETEDDSIRVQRECLMACPGAEDKWIDPTAADCRARVKKALAVLVFAKLCRGDR